jgi:17beta-estradiol 17-dehydrogenase / very-long-chain 3-oxoacyl-CoA reductase
MAISLGPLGSQPPLAAFLITLGFLLAARITYVLSRFLLSTFVLPGTPLSSFGPKGSWAVITGASDGIGKEFALQLSRKGFNLLLISRTQSKLDALSTLITSSTNPVSVGTLAIDFSSPSETDYVHLTNALASKPIAILINNVGQSHSIPVPFTETTLPELQNIIRINCEATLRVTQTVLPRMLPQKRGLVLTMGSFAGLTPTAYLATYSGSKAFLQAWNNALASELGPAGITVQLVQGYLITSAMSKVRRTSWLIPSEKQFVRSVLGKIGNQGGSVGFTHSGSPYWSHAVMAFAITGLVGVYSGIVAGINRSMHVDIRRRALRKAERDGKKL